MGATRGWACCNGGRFRMCPVCLVGFSEPAPFRMLPERPRECVVAIGLLGGTTKTAASPVSRRTFGRLSALVRWPRPCSDADLLHAEDIAYLAFRRREAGVCRVFARRSSRFTWRVSATSSCWLRRAICRTRSALTRAPWPREGRPWHLPQHESEYGCSAASALACARSPGVPLCRVRACFPHLSAYRAAPACLIDCSRVP